MIDMIISTHMQELYLFFNSIDKILELNCDSQYFSPGRESEDKILELSCNSRYWYKQKTTYSISIVLTENHVLVSFLRIEWIDDHLFDC